MMKLSRPVHAAILAVLLLACHHFQLSDCAKPSSSTPRAVFPSAHRHDAEDDAHLRDVVEKTNDAAARAAPSSSDATTPVHVHQGKEEEGVRSGPWRQQESTGALRRAALLRSRLPRRFLAAASGVGSGTGGGAGLSCQTHDANMNCPPPPKRP